MDLFDYFTQDQLSPSLLSLQDKTFDKIVDHLDEFLKNIPQKDRQLLIQIISKCYLKYQNSITNDDKSSITELIIKLLMGMILDQKIAYSKLQFNNDTFSCPK
jgi:hypothetical protein